MRRQHLVASRRRRRRELDHYRVRAQYSNILSATVAISFYRAMLCIRGTSDGPVSVSVCLSQVGVLLKWLNRGSNKQHHTKAQEL